MTWNYRIILHDLDPDPKRHWFGLHEVHYDAPDKTTTGLSWTKNPITFSCDTDEGAEGIIGSLEMALKCLRDPKWPVIKESEVSKGG